MTVDVAAFRRQPNGSYLNSLADARSSGVTITGPEKLAQRVALKLMTPKGTMAYRPNEGTKFVERLMYGRASTEQDVFSVFAAAAADIAATSAGEESIEDPPEERFKAVVLKKLTIAPGQAVMEIEVKNRAGTVAGLRIPLHFTFG